MGGTETNSTDSRESRTGGRIPERALVAAGVVLFALVAFALLQVSSTRKALVEAESAKLTALADTRSAEIELLSDGYRQKADLVASRTRLRELLAAHLDQPDADAVRGMSRIVGDAADSDELIDAISIASLDGTIVAASDDRLIGSMVEDLTASWTGPPAGGAPSEILVDFDGESLALSSAAAMNLDGVHLGTTIVELTPAASDPLLATARFGHSGEAILGFNDGEDPATRFVTPLLRGSAAGFEAAQSQSVPMTDAIHGDEAAFIAIRDYSDASVIAVTRHIPVLDWGLVAKVDVGEVAGQLDPIRNGFIVLGIGLISFGGASGIVYGRRLGREQASRTRAEARFTSMFTSAPIALLLVDEGGVVRLANRSATALLGYDEVELGEMPVSAIVTAEAQDDPPVHAPTPTATPDESLPLLANSKDMVALAADGSQKPIEVALTPIETDDGVMMVTALIDLSERKRAQELLERRAGELERSNKDLDAFAYVASHDLKAPLRAVASLASFVLEDAGDVLPEDSRKDLEQIQKRSGLLMTLLDGLLQYARLGRQSTEPVPIDVSVMLESLSELYVPADRFRLDVSSGLPEICAPQAAVELVFRNLLMNSVRHHDRDSGVITIEGRTEDDQVCFTVSDDGPGIPEGHREKVFQLFKTVDRDEGAPTTGMGLTLSKRAVESHGGTIELLPAAGRSTVFEIRWPCAPYEQRRPTELAGIGSAYVTA